ncbi:hypothetical protein L602_004500000200 [Cupriavidus gilardii J11]|uniref:Lipoprotein n=1 Tax=Cupriavidus gilardii J11 TaxID=936133 RepID=A0A562B7F7_9BURK|nr:hypothetical protein [Cupriavidus gilardii]TWG81117.1 hypothetical protein L602_004500000200 [Cupriavidus gilardii J11]
MKTPMRTPGRWKGAASVAGAVVAAATVALSACAGGSAGAAPGGRQFDVDAFLRAPDTTLSEVLTSTDFLTATQLSANDCAVMLQSTQGTVLEDLPGTARGHAWIRRGQGQPGQAWLVVSRRGGERTCHGPLPYDTLHALATRGAG